MIVVPGLLVVVYRMICWCDDESDRSILNLTFGTLSGLARLLTGLMSVRSS